MKRPSPRWFRQMDRLVRWHLLPHQYPGFAGLVRVQPNTRVRTCGPHVLPRDHTLYREVDGPNGPRRWTLSPAAEAVLFPTGTTVRVHHADGVLYVGFDFPGQDGAIAAPGAGGAFVFADPRRCSTVVTDRLRTRRWVPVRPGGPNVDRAAAPILAPLPDPDEMWVEYDRAPARPRALGHLPSPPAEYAPGERHLIHLPATAFDGLTRTAVEPDGARRYWFAVEWPEPWEPADDPEQALAVNVLPYRERAYEVLRPGNLIRLDATGDRARYAIPTARAWFGSRRHTVRVLRARREAESPEYYDRRAALGSPLRTYRLRADRWRAADEPPAYLARVEFPSAAEPVLVVCYHPLADAARPHAGAEWTSDLGNQVTGGETVAHGGGPDPRPGTWRRCLTRHDFAAAVARFGLFDLGPRLDPGAIRFEPVLRRRAAGRSGGGALLLATEVVVPLPAGLELSAPDRARAECELEADLVARSGLDARIRVRLEG